MSVAAVIVNHNTSAFTELAIRSLFLQNPDLDLTLTVYDNGSSDDRSGMVAAATTYGASIRQSGFPIETPGNSHGEVLRSFALDPAHAGADHLLFLDADVCFTRPGTIAALISAVRNGRDVFGAGPRLSWDGVTPLPTELSANPGLYADRLHPCCALVANTPTFRAVADHIGLSCARMLYAEHERYLDTFALMTAAMRTHGLRHVIVEDAMIMHAFAVSYPDESSVLLPQKEQRRDHWLGIMRRRT